MKKILFLLGILVSLASCQYEGIELADVLPPDPDEPIDETITLSFATDIVPIFSDNACTACHDVGGQNPDLTAANAYQSLVSGSYLVSNNPEASIIYTFPHPDASTHRWGIYSNRDAELLFTWINQGAVDN